MGRAEIIDLAVRELHEFFPLAADARLERAHVVKEVRATFSAAPGLEAKRPGTETPIPTSFLAGDWTRSGWPATMEEPFGAVHRCGGGDWAFGQPKRFLLVDVG